jgi:multiple sugar transport system permease protein
VTTTVAAKPAGSRRFSFGRRGPWAVFGAVGIYVVIGAVAVFNVLPFSWPLVSAFGVKPENVSGLYLFWPSHLTLDHFRKAIFGRGDALVLLRNSLLCTGASVLIAVCVCSLAGYALSRGRFRFKRPLMYGILLVQIIPATATVLPYYLTMREMGLVNTLLGVTLGLATAQIPFVVWVMKGFFDAVPMELEEAAWLDGASRLRALRHVILPVALPGVGAATVLAFNAAWGAFFLPLIMLSSPEKFVLSLGLFRAIIGYTNIDYGMMNAMALIYMAPSLLLFLFARKYLIQGAMAGAMAGG